MTICGRRENLLLASVDQIKTVIAESRGAGRIRHVVADVKNEDEVKKVVDFALEPTGSLDGCVANAGGGGGMGPYHLQNTAEFIRVLHLNVLGTLFFVKHTIPRMVAAGGGSFVGMSSIAGHQTHPFFGAYTVSKAGIEQMMRNAADEYGPVKVRFNAIRPGFISTEIMEGIPRNSPVYDSYIENTPMQDVGE
ncbi:MAG: SDR family oxidoreductase, partial [Actinobacteria bacterium]